jgi:hypothetical protein
VHCVPLNYFLDRTVACGSLVEDKVPLNCICRSPRQTDRGRRFEWAPQASVCSSWNYGPCIYLLTEVFEIESFDISVYPGPGQILRYLRDTECRSQVTITADSYSRVQALFRRPPLNTEYFSVFSVLKENKVSDSTLK